MKKKKTEKAIEQAKKQKFMENAIPRIYIALSQQTLPRTSYSMLENYLSYPAWYGWIQNISLLKILSQGQKSMIKRLLSLPDSAF